jgi:diaminopimelate epimerase
MEGLGNDFLVVDGAFDPEPGMIERWCARRTGVGADGVLALTPIDRTRVRMRYWNADGREAEMCGNGLRCVALLAAQRGWVFDANFIVESAVGDHPVEILDDGLVRAFVGVPRGFRTDELVVGDYTVHPVSVGNPHAVMFVDDVEEAPVAEAGPRISTDALFPGGTNVEFVEVVGGDVVRARVWERGVGETRASGTGGTAAAFAARSRDELGDVVTVQLRGGELVVEFDEAGAWMLGPAHVTFRGSVD